MRAWAGRALNRRKLKMAEEILNFTTKSGTASEKNNTDLLLES